MSFRTTEAAVKGIIEVEDTDDLTPFIETANGLVTDVCTHSHYADEKLERIERWLSAHFYAVMSSRHRVDEVKTLREEFQSKVDLGLDITHYGQQAMRIDTAGNLAVLNNSVKKKDIVLPAQNRTLTVRWLGKARGSI